MSIYAIAVAFIALDFLTGLYKAGALGAISSRVMFQGLWRKAGLLLLMLCAAAADWAQAYVDIGVHVSAGAAVCVYIIIMELTSALGNICAACPDIAPKKLCELFGLDVYRSDFFDFDDDEEDKA